MRFILQLETGPEFDEFHDPEYPEVGDMTRVTGLGLVSICDTEDLEVERK